MLTQGKAGDAGDQVSEAMFLARTTFSVQLKINYSVLKTSLNWKNSSSLKSRGGGPPYLDYLLPTTYYLRY